MCVLALGLSSSKRLLRILQVQGRSLVLFLGRRIRGSLLVKADTCWVPRPEDPTEFLTYALRE